MASLNEIPATTKVCEFPGCGASAKGFMVFEAVLVQGDEKRVTDAPTLPVLRPGPMSLPILPVPKGWRCLEHARIASSDPVWSRAREDFTKRLGLDIPAAQVHAALSSLSELEAAQLIKLAAGGPVDMSVEVPQPEVVSMDEF